MKISLKLVYQYMIIFFNFSLTSSHLHPLQVENCDSNLRLVVDEDENGKFRFERVSVVLVLADHIASLVEPRFVQPYEKNTQSPNLDKKCVTKKLLKVRRRKNDSRSIYIAYPSLGVEINAILRLFSLQAYCR